MSSTADGPGAPIPDERTLPPELSPRVGSRASAASARRGGSRAGRFVRGVAVIASAMVVMVSAAGYAASQHYLGEVNQIDAFKNVTNRPDKLDVPAQNILIAGVDDRATLTAAQRREYNTGNDAPGRRSDTMMLVHISDEQKSVTAVSLPRDSLVTIPAWTDDAGVKHPASKNKLNAAFAYGGADLTIETIEKATGIRIDHYVEVDLGGFVRMVDAIGGVDVCTSTPLSDRDSNLNLPAGKSRLDGVQSLAFVRARHIYADQDFGRIRAQQRFIGSMIKRATSSGVLLNPVKLNKVLSSVTKSLQTDMSEKELLEQARQMRDYKPADISFLTVPIANGNLYVPGVGSAASWDKKEAKALFSKLRNDEPLTKKSTAKLTVPPGSITVQVLNGSEVQGLGARAAEDLAGLGFGMADIAKNADVTGQTATVVRYGPDQAAAARTVLAAIPGSTGTQIDGLGTIEVVVGSDYTGVKKVTVAGATPSSTPKARTAADDVCS